MRAERLDRVAGAVFAKLEGIKAEVEVAGTPVINLGVGSPDRPPAPHLVETLRNAVGRYGEYGYAMTARPHLLEAISRWYGRRFGVSLDPETEVLPLMGTQEGWAHLFLAITNPGDVVLVPDPGYPIYHSAPVLAGCEIHRLPLRAENDYLPDLEAVPAGILRRARAVILNYPANPVTAVAPPDFFRRAVEWAHRTGVLLCHDAAYSELAFDGRRPPSILEVDGAKEVAVEFHSLSKTYNLAGARLGYMVGNREVVGALRELKGHLDYGIFLPLQELAVAALTGPQDFVYELRDTYQHRRDVLVLALNELGWPVPLPPATMFCWAPVPEGESSEHFASRLLRETGVMVVPGTGFGPGGEGYVRIGLVAEVDTLREVARRIAAAGLFKQR